MLTWGAPRNIKLDSEATSPYLLNASQSVSNPTSSSFKNAIPAVNSLTIISGESSDVLRVGMAGVAVDNASGMEPIGNYGFLVSLRTDYLESSHSRQIWAVQLTELCTARS